MITGTSNVCEIFSLFHDGVIAACRSDASDLYLDVRIAYIAQQVHPDYCGFLVKLCDVHGLSFTTWPKQAEAAPSTLLTVADIFEPALQILDGEHQGEVIKVSCNQRSAATAHCGGFLTFSANGAVVSDEAGRHYTIEELGQLCMAYWEKWRARQTPGMDSRRKCCRETLHSSWLPKAPRL